MAEKLYETQMAKKKSELVIAMFLCSALRY